MWRAKRKGRVCSAPSLRSNYRLILFLHQQHIGGGTKGKLQLSGKTGIVKVSFVSVSLCRLCPPVKADGLVAVFGLKVNSAPRIPRSEVVKNFAHPLRPAGITVPSLGTVRGKLPVKKALNWQALALKVKLKAFSASSKSKPKMLLTVPAPVVRSPPVRLITIRVLLPSAGLGMLSAASVRPLQTPITAVVEPASHTG